MKLLCLLVVGYLAAIKFDEMYDVKVHCAGRRPTYERSPSFRQTKIPLSIFKCGGRKLAQCHFGSGGCSENVYKDPVALDELVEPVIRYSLARRDVNAHTLSMHRIVQEVLRNEMTSGERHMWMECIVHAVDKCFLMPMEFDHWLFCERLIPHALLAV